LEAIGKPAKIAARAKELGMSAIAITDYNGMFGAIKFLQAVKMNESTYFLSWTLICSWMLILNIPLTILVILFFLQKRQRIFISWWNLLLMQILWIKQKPKVDLGCYSFFSSGVIAFFGGTQSWIGKMILRDESREKIIEIIGMLQSILGKDACLLRNYSSIFISENKELERVNTYVFLCVENLNSLFVNSNYHYIKKSDKDAWEVALAVKDAKKIYDLDRRKPLGDYHIMSEDEVKEILLTHDILPIKFKSLLMPIWH
jgi:DNA polymerase III subunit alpha